MGSGEVRESELEIRKLCQTRHNLIHLSLVPIHDKIWETTDTLEIDRFRIGYSPEEIHHIRVEGYLEYIITIF